MQRDPRDDYYCAVCLEHEAYCSLCYQSRVRYMMQDHYAAHYAKTFAEYYAAYYGRFYAPLFAAATVRQRDWGRVEGEGW